jgi:hypothetical protein
MKGGIGTPKRFLTSPAGRQVRNDKRNLPNYKRKPSTSQRKISVTIREMFGMTRIAFYRQSLTAIKSFSQGKP